MAGVYQTIWTYRPDYFRVQQGVNFLPIDLIEMMREGAKPPGAIQQFSNSEGEEQDISALFREYMAVIDDQMTKADKARELRELLNEGQREFERATFKKMNEYVQSEISEIDSEIKNKEKEIAALRSPSLPFIPNGGVNETNENRLKIAELAVAIAELKLRYVEKEAEARRYGLSNLVQFQDDPEQIKHIELIKSTQAAEKEAFIAFEKVNSFRAKAYEALHAYRSQSLSKLGYFDFLYFSVGAATTATFGDISPNRTTVRILVCLQVIVSILFVGYLVNKLSKG